MRIIKTLIAVAALFAGLTENAQTSAADLEAQELGYKPYPHWFIQVQGGVGTTFTNRKFTDLISPTASVGFGRWFAPAIGARLHVNAWESKGGFKSIENTYKYKYVNSNLDLLINLNNLFAKNNFHRLNFILVGGVGLNYAWKNDDLIAIKNLPKESTANAWGKGQNREDLLSHNLRAGLMIDYNVAKHFSIGLEVDANNLDDRFNSKYNDADDWMVTAQLSLTYKFGFKKASKPQPVVIVPRNTYDESPHVDNAIVEKPKPQEPKPEPVVVKEEPLKETIFYLIRESNVDPKPILEKCAAWAKKYPNKTLTVQGYADKGTGNPKINVGYAKQRADKVAAGLEKLGVEKSRISVSSYGDTVQPFAAHDKNRCVIIEGK